MPEDCDAHKSQYTICKESGKLANEYCPSQERRSANYVVEKERLGLWTTPGINSVMGSAPTEHCTIHTKPAETEKPAENTTTKVEKPETNTTEKPNSGSSNTSSGSDNSKPNDTQKPSTGGSSEEMGGLRRGKATAGGSRKGNRGHGKAA